MPVMRCDYEQRDNTTSPIPNSEHCPLDWRIDATVNGIQPPDLNEDLDHELELARFGGSFLDTEATKFTCVWPKVPSILSNPRAMISSNQATILPRVTLLKPVL
jgi:hypothetical protein